MVHPTGPGGSASDERRAMQDMEVALALTGALTDETMLDDLSELYGPEAARMYMSSLGQRQFDEELDSYV